MYIDPREHRQVKTRELLRRSDSIGRWAPTTWLPGSRPSARCIAVTSYAWATGAGEFTVGNGLRENHGICCSASCEI